MGSSLLKIISPSIVLQVCNDLAAVSTSWLVTFSTRPSAPDPLMWLSNDVPLRTFSASTKWVRY